MDLNKIKLIVNWQTPICLKEVPAFMRFCNFYRRFIKDFSKTVKPLMSLTRKEYLFFWSEICQEVFQCSKIMVTSAPVFRNYDRGRPAVLETDSLGYINGGVIS